MKIRDKERNEPPHATVIKGTLSWRWNLRTKAFLDVEPDPHLLPPDLTKELAQAHGVLTTEWDAMYPLNPVWSRGDDDE